MHLPTSWYVIYFTIFVSHAVLPSCQIYNNFPSKIACFLTDAKNIVRKFRLYLKAIIMQTGYKKLHMQVVNKQCFVSLFLSKTC